MDKKVSMQMIADKLGITKVSVSKALNGKEGTSKELSRRIIQTANDMGYKVKKISAKNSRLEFTFLVLSEFFEKRGESFYTKIYANLNNYCLVKGANLTLFVIGHHEHENLILPSMMNESRWDGVFLAGEFSDDYVSTVKKFSNKMVTVDFCPKSFKTDCVISDNFYLGYCAASHLIAAGHRKIAFLGLPTKTNAVCDRFFGYKKALYINGIEFNEEYLINNENMISDLYAVDLNLPADMPTACVCNCDAAAFYFSEVLHRKGIKVGQDISLISFDNTEVCEAMTPKLTSYDIDKFTFAKLAYMLMKERLKDLSKEEIRVYSNSKLIRRDSIKYFN